jgi:hypothetical protein
MPSQKHHSAWEAGLASLRCPLFFPTRLAAVEVCKQSKKIFLRARVSRLEGKRKVLEACKMLGEL